MRKYFAALVLLVISVTGVQAAGGNAPFLVPVMGPRVHIFDQSAGEEKPWYINDHCFIKGADGRYHLFGITHAKERIPPAEYEREFAHASSRELFSVPWQKHPPVLQYDRALGESHVWAPHVIEKDGVYYMFYAAGGSHTASRIDLATSKDLFNWERPPVNPLFRDFYDARDPMVFKYGDEYLMYYCKTYSTKDYRSTVSIRRSKDLLSWSAPEYALVISDRPLLVNSGHTESPYLFSYSGKFYLAICTPYFHYQLTRIFISDNPFHFDEQNEITSFISHGAEFPEFEGKLYASGAGWFYDGVYLSRVTWQPAKKFSPQFRFLNSGESNEYLVDKKKTNVAVPVISGIFSGNKVLSIGKGGCVRYEIPVPKDLKQMQLFICGRGKYQVVINGKPWTRPKDPNSSEGLDLYWLDDENLWPTGKLQIEISNPPEGTGYGLNFLRIYFIN